MTFYRELTANGLAVWLIKLWQRVTGQRARCRGCGLAVPPEALPAFVQAGCPQCGGKKLDAYRA